jgi:hypothetical protein
LAICDFAIADCQLPIERLSITPLSIRIDLPLPIARSGLSITDVFAIADYRLPIVD